MKVRIIEGPDPEKTRERAYDVLIEALWKQIEKDEQEERLLEDKNK